MSSWLMKTVVLTVMMIGIGGGHSAFAETMNVESITLMWDRTHALLPDLEDLETVPIRLKRGSNGLVAPSKDDSTIRTDLAAINQMGGVQLSTGALDVIIERLVEALKKDGLVGVTITAGQLPAAGTALRRVDLYLVATLPLQGGRPNRLIPANLQPIRKGEAVTSGELEPAASRTWIIKSARARWKQPDPLMVDATSVLSVPVRLGERDDIYTNPQDGRRILSMSIRRFIGDGTHAFNEMAVESMGMAVAQHLKQQGFDQAIVTAEVSSGGQLILELDLEASEPDAESNEQDAEAQVQPEEPAAEVTTPPVQTRTEEEEPSPAKATQEEAAASDVSPTEAMEPEAAESAGVDASAEAETEAEPAETFPNEPGTMDGTSYIADPLLVDYRHPHPDLPSTAFFMDMPIILGLTDEGWIAPRENVNVVETSINEINADGGGVFWSSAIATITSAISRVLVEDDLLGVFVIPDQQQISAAAGSIGLDLRPVDQTELTIMITVGRVVETRTVAQGNRIEEGEEVNHVTHKAIKGSSPIQPHDGEAEIASGPRADLLRQDQLTDYIHRLNRHPGRQVEASVAAAAVPGGVSLDFLVFEPNPLTLYYEIGNTGTPQEEGLRQRFGIFHSQLTGNDDVLSLEYVTSNFSTTNAVLGSYQFRVTDDNRVRGGLMGSWNKFVNDQFGDEFIDYTGYSWSTGGQLIFNVYQDGPFFIDVVPGVNYQKVKVSNELLNDSGIAGFLLPYAQLQASRQDDQGLFQAMVGIEGSPLSQSNQELTLLGRLNPSERWARMNWSASLSTFLEPLLNPVEWGNPETPETSTLAHELAFRFSGQYSFGSRLVPQFQSIMGGIYSVRGYAQSVVAGDNSIFGSLEYRFHIPRTFAVQPEPIDFMGAPFRAAPQYVYGRPDWDLILKAFFDAGYVFQNGNLPFEVNNTLLGAGIGMEFLYKSNLRVRMDWGFALHDLKFGLAEAGTSRLYVTGTFLW
ncbi:MAG: hypothetical protein CMJ39_12580 [Phycisphaerae bacterium]|nr:hypothetical protein [Phycisphaerae bacterium]